MKTAIIRTAVALLLLAAAVHVLPSPWDGRLLLAALYLVLLVLALAFVGMAGRGEARA